MSMELQLAKESHKYGGGGGENSVNTKYVKN